MSACTLGACIYFIPVRWTARIGPTYMLAGMLGACTHFIAVGWTARSGCTYMSAGTPGAHMIISGSRHYLWLKDIISAQIGWNTICGHLTHMKICLK